MALVVLHHPHSCGFLLRPQPSSGRAQWVGEHQLLSNQLITVFHILEISVCFMSANDNSEAKKSCTFVFVSTGSLLRSERKPSLVESSRSYESASSWMRISMATWNGSRRLRFWMLTERAKVTIIIIYPRMHVWVFQDIPGHSSPYMHYSQVFCLWPVETLTQTACMTWKARVKSFTTSESDALFIQTPNNSRSWVSTCLFYLCVLLCHQPSRS